MMNHIELNTQGFADESGYIKCHICHPQTREYLGESDEFISQHTGLPAWAYLDAPPKTAKPEHAMVRTDDDAGWREVEDHRGATVYDTATKAKSDIKELGEVPAGKTLLAPSSPFDKWTGAGWEYDASVEQQATLDEAIAGQSARITNSNQQIAILKPAVDGGYAKPEHVQLLADWQRYRYELTSVPEQPSWPESPQWPDQPETII